MSLPPSGLSDEKQRVCQLSGSQCRTSGHHDTPTVLSSEVPAWGHACPPVSSPLQSQFLSSQGDSPCLPPPPLFFLPSPSSCHLPELSPHLKPRPPLKAQGQSTLTAGCRPLATSSGSLLASCRPSPGHPVMHQCVTSLAAEFGDHRTWLSLPRTEGHTFPVRHPQPRPAPREHVPGHDIT